MVVAEGAECDAETLKTTSRLTIIIWVRAAGDHSRARTARRRPLAFDRLLASRLGARAAELLANDEWGVLVGMIKGEVATTPLEEIAGKRKPIDLDMYRLAGILAK